MSDGVTDLPFAEWEWVLAHGSFEEVYACLETVVARLEDGALSLADSVSCYELGVLLADRCDQILGEAELRISRIEALAEAAGEARGGDNGVRPFDEVPF